MSNVQWSEQETLSSFLTYRPPQSEAHVVSCLIAALRDARRTSGRFEDSGKLDPSRASQMDCWLGALGYLVMLEQIGKCYRRSGGALNGNHPAFVKALMSFAPELSGDESYALWALRSSFAHNYGLINNKRKDDPRLIHHFMLDATLDSNTPVVRIPATRWDGQLTHLRKANATWVDLRALGDLAENVYQQLVHAHEEGSLEIALTGGLDELQDRHGMTVWPNLTMIDT